MGIFTAIFLIQYFCLHSILLFSKSYPEIENTWSTANCKLRKSFCTWYYIVICATLLLKLLIKIKNQNQKSINVFPKHVLKAKARD